MTRREGGELPGKDLIGSYLLLSAERIRPDGGIDRPYGADPQGYIVFTAEGLMLSILAEAGRPPLSGPDLLTGERAGKASEEIAQAFQSFGAFAGRYEVHGDEVTNNLELSLYPNWSGTAQVRKWELDGSVLSLYPPGWIVRYQRMAGV